MTSQESKDDYTDQEIVDATEDACRGTPTKPSEAVFAKMREIKAARADAIAALPETRNRKAAAKALFHKKDEDIFPFLLADILAQRRAKAVAAAAAKGV